jgi:hypothetical protein
VLQLVYISTVVGPAPTGPILAISQENNARAGITGLLYADGRRFLQALEGEAGAVTRTFERIARDPRHRALVVLSRREVAVREFGRWAMAERDGATSDDGLMQRIEDLVAQAAPGVRATFDSFARLHRAA